jgi:hypothetical protein
MLLALTPWQYLLVMIGVWVWVCISPKSCLRRKKSFNTCRWCWRFEKIGIFLLKLNCSLKENAWPTSIVYTSPGHFSNAINCLIIVSSGHT